ncbi:MAG: nitrophenyl compound nitroreductase subunit ArsF family protein [Bacteroidales bacterium]|nr:nitrophenyl compound nitroreductase subunit ArsF family protein [Bacteroidales bacterium]
MKKILLASILLLLVTGTVLAQKPTKLKIVYFHSERRCPTCISIEDNTKKTLNTYFANQLKDGSITLQILNVEEEKNLKMVEKYKAEGSSLFLTKVRGSKETNTDFTNFAFSYSRNQAEKFIAGLKAEIEKNLK